MFANLAYLIFSAAPTKVTTQIGRIQVKAHVRNAILSKVNRRGRRPSEMPGYASDGGKNAAEVHLWLANLDEVHAANIERYKAGFTAAEHAQYSGFLSERRRREFIVGRGLARLALAREVEDDKENFEFESDSQGKLSIKSPVSARSFNFNISHTADLVACATCRCFEIGLDIERVESRIDPILIAKRFFNPAEADALRALNPAARLEKFSHFGRSRKPWPRRMAWAWPLHCMPAISKYPKMVRSKP